MSQRLRVPSYVVAMIPWPGISQKFMGEKNHGKDAKENTPIFSDGHKVVFKWNLHSSYANRLTGGSGEVNQSVAVRMGSRAERTLLLTQEFS